VAVLSWPQSIPIVGCFSCSSPLLGPLFIGRPFFFLAGSYHSRVAWLLLRLRVVVGVVALWGVVQVWELSEWGLPSSLTAEFRVGSMV
jgi:hypothetical protein